VRLVASMLNVEHITRGVEIPEAIGIVRGEWRPLVLDKKSH
jgi:hypothetical protein